MRMRRQQSANHESKQLHTGRVSTKSLSRAFNNGYQIPKWPITEILGGGGGMNGITSFRRLKGGHIQKRKDKRKMSQLFINSGN